MLLALVNNRQIEEQSTTICLDVPYSFLHFHGLSPSTAFRKSLDYTTPKRGLNGKNLLL